MPSTKIAPSGEEFVEFSSRNSIPSDEYQSRIRALEQESSATEKTKKLRGFAVPLAAKREIRNIVSQSGNFKSTSLACKIYCMRCKAECINLSVKAEIWRNSFKKIEGLYGSGVLSYFVFLKYLFFLNVLLFLLTFIFTVVPQAANSSGAAENSMLKSLTSSSSALGSLSATCSAQYKQNWTSSINSATISTKIQDFFQGTGWLARTVLFYGFYFPAHLQVGIVSYNMPLAYITCMGVFFFISLLFMLRKTGESFQEVVVSGARNKKHKYSSIVLTGWDFSLMDDVNSKLKHKHILNTIWGEIQDEKHIERHLNMSQGRKCCLWLVRILINLLIIALLGGAAYLIYFVQTVSSKLTNDGSLARGSFLFFFFEFLPSITISAIGAIYPIIFTILVKLEDYRMETSVLLTLLRTVFVRLAALAMLLATVYIIITCGTKTNCLIGYGDCTSIDCWETYMGQQFYKLLLTFFLVALIVTFLVEWPRSLLAKKCSCALAKLIGQPEFDTPKNVLDLIYVQILCWLGTLFCPMLPGMTFIVLLILFYCKKFSCYFCYRPSNTPYRATSSTIFFMVLLFVSYFLCLTPIGWLVIRKTTSRTCGPFRTQSYIYDIIPLVINGWPQWTRSLFSFLSSAAFLYLVLVILVIIIYYYATMAKAQKNINRVLETQLQIESSDKQALAQQLALATGKPMKSFKRSENIKEKPKTETNLKQDVHTEGQEEWN